MLRGRRPARRRIHRGQRESSGGISASSYHVTLSGHARTPLREDSERTMALLLQVVFPEPVRPAS
jgi:hypothetical protein